MKTKAIYFGVEWCGQCKTLRPRFIAECDRLGIDHEELDADEDSTIFESYGIRNIPFIVVLEGETVRTEGVAADIIPKLKDHVLVDGNEEFDYGHAVRYDE